MKIFIVSCLLLIWALIGTGFAAAEPSCGVAHMDSFERIVGGAYAKPHQFPWMAAIKIHYSPNDGGNMGILSTCDGSLIDDRWIVTAAHCFGPQSGYHLRSVEVLLGAHDLSNPAEHRFVLQPKHVFRHSLYTDTVGSKNDITLVQLPQRLNLTAVRSTVAPICLPHAGQSVSKTRCNAVGWGRVGPLSIDKPSPVLKYVELSLMTGHECQRYRAGVSDLQVCAGYQGHGTCQGDSGGPLECRASDGSYVLQGVTSYGDLHCGGSNPSVFTNVERYISWIDQIRNSNKN